MLRRRPKDAASFTLGFNGRVGRVLMDAELAAAGVIPPIDIVTAAKVSYFFRGPVRQPSQHVPGRLH